MERYVGLDVSLKLTSICIVDRTGKVEREGVVASDPEAIGTFIKLHAPHVVRIGLETGATSTWLWTELNKVGLPIVCIDASHAKAGDSWHRPSHGSLLPCDDRRPRSLQEITKRRSLRGTNDPPIRIRRD